MTTDRKEEFRKRLEGVRTGMLEVEGRYVPMSHSLTDGDDYIWFLTARETDMAKAAKQGDQARYVVSSDDKGLYADIEGHLQEVTDPETLDEIWNVVAASWFEDGKRDPDLVLVRYTPKTAEVWLTEGGAIKFFYQVARANITGKHPDMGSRFTLNFD